MPLYKSALNLFSNTLKYLYYYFNIQFNNNKKETTATP